MGWLKVFFFHSVFLFLTITSGSSHEFSSQYDCPTTRCSRHGPQIRFPFGKQGSQHQDRCSYPGFELSCKGKQTVLHLPFTREVEVSHIDYGSQRLRVVDSNGCIQGLLFHLNLSSSPFSYYSSSGPMNITVVNCSVGVSFGYGGYFACMSDLEHDVFLLPSDYRVESLPLSCQSIETLEVPPPYTLDNHVNLKWDIPRCSGCDEAKRWMCGFKDKTHTNETTCFYYRNEGSWKKQVIIGTSLGSFVILVALLISLKFYHSWKLEREKDRENWLKVEKFLEDYKSLKPTRYSYADLKRMTDQFKEKLGQGGYGSVYKGMLANGDLVAVKILQKSGGDGKDFINEVGTIGSVDAKNWYVLLRPFHLHKKETKETLARAGDPPMPKSGVGSKKRVSGRVFAYLSPWRSPVFIGMGRSHRARILLLISRRIGINLFLDSVRSRDLQDWGSLY